MPVLFSFQKMKTKFLLFGASTIVLFSGCLGQTAVPTDGTLPPNPTATFDDLTQKSRDAWANEVASMLPDFISFKKYASDFSLKGEAQIPEMGGSASFALTATGENDMTDPSNIVGKSDISLSGDISGMFTGSMKLDLSFILANKSVFLSIKELILDFPMIPSSQVVEPLKASFGKWYGDTFEKIDELTGGQMNIAESIVSAKTPAQMSDELIRIIQTRKIWKMVSAEAVTGGQYVFEVELDKAELKGAILDFLALGNIPQEEKTTIEADLDKDLAVLEVKGKLFLSAQDPKDFRFNGVVVSTKEGESSSTNIVVVMNENEKSFSGKTTETGEHASFSIKSEGGVENFEVIGGKTAEENQTLVRGSKSENEMKATFFDPELGTEVATIILAQKDKKWSGTIQMKDQPVVVQIADLEIGGTKIAGKVTVKNGETELGKAEMSYSITEKSGISVSAPAEFESFDQLKPILIESFGALSGPSSLSSPEGTGGELPSSMTDAQLQELMQNSDRGMSEEEIAEMMNALPPTEGKIPEDPSMIDVTEEITE